MLFGFYTPNYQNSKKDLAGYILAENIEAAYVKLNEGIKVDEGDELIEIKKEQPEFQEFCDLVSNRFNRAVVNQAIINLKGDQKTDDDIKTLGFLDESIFNNLNKLKLLGFNFDDVMVGDSNKEWFINEIANSANIRKLLQEKLQKNQD